RASHRPAHEQPAQGSGARGLRPAHREPRAGRGDAEPAQPPLPLDQARQARAPARAGAGGGLSAVGRRFAVVAARSNERLVQRLVDAALDTLRREGARDEDVELSWVPGSFELPVAASWAADSGRFDAVLAFGVVIRGETEHFRLVADGAAQGLQRVALDTG